MKTAEHSRRVAEEAKRLAQCWGEDESRAEIAGWLHDISVIIPRDQYLPAAEALRIEIIDEERKAPILIHQKLSAFIAQDVFGVNDKLILSAIGCHTTLKIDSSKLDKIVFVADKIAWDQPGDPPYLPQMVLGLDRSLDLAALCYLNYLWRRKDSLPAIHPWMIQAYLQLSKRFTIFP
ncbi:MAG: bis(5'-nucleosyl)-tetraphosphatase (symmetrical) YqeK [Anaerolineales bacterium]|nr:bis(5'-nucleosyl)-tetraphosphatase (symmetrical) YqeK [Anaerolineales bacterium]